MIKILTSNVNYAKVVRTFKERLSKLGQMKVALRVDPAQLQAESNRVAYLGYRAGKLMAWVKQMSEQLGYEFETWEAGRRREIKRRLAEAKGFKAEVKYGATETVKETEIKEELRLDPEWLKLKLRLAEFKGYSVLIEHGVFWSVVRLPKTLDKMMLCTLGTEKVKDYEEEE